MSLPNFVITFLDRFFSGVGGLSHPCDTVPPRPGSQRENACALSGSACGLTTALNIDPRTLLLVNTL